MGMLIRSLFAVLLLVGVVGKEFAFHLERVMRQHLVEVVHGRLLRLPEVAVDVPRDAVDAQRHRVPLRIAAQKLDLLLVLRALKHIVLLENATYEIGIKSKTTTTTTTITTK